MPKPIEFTSKELCFIIDALASFSGIDSPIIFYAKNFISKDCRQKEVKKIFQKIAAISPLEARWK